MIHPSKIRSLPVAENLDFSIIVTTLKNHAPGRFQDPSRRFQNALKTPPKTLQDAPKMVQNGPKRLQRRSRTIHVADQREYRCALVYSHTATDSHRQPQTAIDSHRQPQRATDVLVLSILGGASNHEKDNDVDRAFCKRLVSLCGRAHSASSFRCCCMCQCF